jgi:hypothetical protein
VGFGAANALVVTGLADMSSQEEWETKLGTTRNKEKIQGKFIPAGPPDPDEPRNSSSPAARDKLALPTSNKKRRTSFGVLRSPERATHRTIEFDLFSFCEYMFFLFDD